MVSYINVYVASLAVSLSWSCVVWRQNRWWIVFLLFLALFTPLFFIPFFHPNIFQIIDEILLSVPRLLFWEKSESILLCSLFPLQTLNSVIAFVSRIKQLKSHWWRRDYSHPEKIYKDTIERQSDFIWMISHEIKTPITSAILQSESIMQDINSGDKSQKYLKNEITLLNVQLVRTGELLSKLFSVQYYDTHDVVLTREKILFRDFVTYEIAYYQEIHKEILFLTHIDPNLRFVELDRVQFRQVITNLVENAIKFVNAQKPIISITVQKVWTYFELIIEDNGAWFQGIEIWDLFDKYTSWKEKAIWIWMWLYLCKKIVELHSWTISATISQKYKWAKFTLCIPINN